MPSKEPLFMENATEQIRNRYNPAQNKQNGFSEINKKVLNSNDMEIIDPYNDGLITVNDDNVNEQGLSEIQRFYHGKNVLITGGTGFLGKVLIEKLLRGCPHIGNLYVLVRQKKGKDIHTRLDEMFADPLFDTVKEKVPKFRHKIVVVPGDCQEAGLDLSIEDRETLIEKINVVFHSAATVRFDEPLRVALALNVRAGIHLLDLAKQMKGLLAYVHISTAYTNCHLSYIEEKFYPFETTNEQLLARIANMTDDEIAEGLPDILGPWPNTYTFTKALAEKELRTNCGNIPIGIYRPAIVTSTAKEPIKSWVDNMFGPTALAVGVATGVLRTLYIDSDVAAELVPVDMVVNSIIAIGNQVNKQYSSSSPPSEPLIYNYVSSAENRITWRDYMNHNTKEVNVTPFSNAIWFMSLTMTKYRYLYVLLSTLFHTLPAAIIDTLAYVKGTKPKMQKVYQRMDRLTSALTFFITREIVFCNKHTRELWENTSEQDKKIFPFDMKSLDWATYYKDYILGIRRYTFKDSDDTLPAAKIQWRRLYYLHQALRFILFSIVVFLLWSVLRKF